MQVQVPEYYTTISDFSKNLATKSSFLCKTQNEKQLMIMLSIIPQNNSVTVKQSSGDSYVLIV